MQLASSISVRNGSFPSQTYAAGDSEIANLRREQEDFRKRVRAESRKNSWMLLPALGPVAAVLGLEAGAALAGGLLAPQVRRVPFSFLEQEAAEGAGSTAARQARPQPGPRLTGPQKGAIRDEARTRYARAYGLSASDMEAQVHHRISLEFSHVMPKADPNRLANLAALERQAHDIASREWVAFSRSLAGREPTQAEIMAQALRIDKMIEPYILRAGVPRQAPAPPPKGTQ